MIKKIAVSICLLFTLLGLAQEGTSSPYSYYGIGEVRFKGTAETRAMGGVSIFPDSIHLNLQNPASLSSLKFTTFTLGGSYSTTTLETEAQKENAQRGSIDYFAVGFPIGKKMGATFGLMPYTSVGYKIQTFGTVGELQSDRRFTGTGGINRVFFGTAYKFTPNFSIGADVSYNFGRIETASLEAVTGIQYATREINGSDIGGANFSIGLMYDGKVNEKLRYFTGVTYSTEGNLRSENEREIATVQVFQTGGTAVVGDPLNVDVPNSTLSIPSKLTFGAGIGAARHWMIGAEASLQQSSNQNNRFNRDVNSPDAQNVQFEDGIRYSLGGYFIPKYTSFTSYLSRVTYRAGIRYENTGLVIRNKSIFDTGVNIGLGLPVGGTFSNINLGLEVGKRGTVYGGLVRENYANVIVGFSFNDRWFVKRKYD
ncbi:MAG TPA: outer membrane protein transport protein [Flavobacterium sp.]|jgi:long-subunit fatty acid transport protein